MHRFKNVVGWPDKIRVGKQADATKHYEVDGEQAMIFMMQRNKCGTKFTEMEFKYGPSFNSICEQSLSAEQWLVDNHAHRLRNLGFFKNRFSAYAAAVQALILRNGDQVPPEGERYIGFLDRTSIRISKPTGNWNFQRLFYSWKSKFHNLAYQGLYAPDGMFIHFWGPKAGIHNDRLLLSQSGVNRILEDLQRLPGRLLPPVHLRFSCYTDRGYENHSFVSAAHHGILVTALQVMYNAIMSPARVCVEWGFGKLKNLSKLLQSADNTHLQGSNVDYHIQAAMLLCNANTCLHGAQATKLFACLPPTLESYFA